MRRGTIAVGLAALLTACGGGQGVTPKGPGGKAGPAAATPTPKPKTPGFVRVIFFKMKPEAKAEDLALLVADCRRILKGIPGVQDLRVGQKAEEERETAFKDYDVALYVRFGRKEDLARFTVHPKHVEFVERHRFNVAGRQVIDFSSEE